MMQIIDSITSIRREIKQYKRTDKIVGFVPTMGYLHEGHQSLIQKASEQCDIVVVSIFVNPLQFGKNEDFEKYPKDLERDAILCAEAGAGILFTPRANEIILDNQLSSVDIEILDKHLCGSKRIGHFKGVCTIVAKLFNIILPDKAYFGKKDIQQLTIIDKMVTDLNYSIEIVPVETKRDFDNLALSSRNSYLSANERKAAIIVPKVLNYIVNMIKSGTTDVNSLISDATKFALKEPMVVIDYIEIVDKNTLQPVDSIDPQMQDKYIIAVAIFIGKTRLIDNHIY